MRYFFCILIAYLIGSLSPAALIAKLKHKNLSKEGTGNLGATNTSLVIGKMFGLLVMVLDIFKGFFAVIGHCFPFYMKFKGGKGSYFCGIYKQKRPVDSSVYRDVLIYDNHIYPKFEKSDQGRGTQKQRLYEKAFLKKIT